MKYKAWDGFGFDPSDEETKAVVLPSTSVRVHLFSIVKALSIALFVKFWLGVSKGS